MTIFDYLNEDEYLETLFSDFRKEELECIEVAYFASDIPIIRKEAVASYVYLIVNGICGIFKELENGESFCYYKISSYDVIGLSELLKSKHVRHASVRTLSDVVAFKIKKSDLMLWMTNHPDFYNEIISNVIYRLHNTITKHVESKKYNVHANLVSYLIHSYNLYKRSYPRGYKGEVKINETREMISDFIGISIRSTNSTIEILKNENLVNIHHGKIYINEEQWEMLQGYKLNLLM